MVGVGMLVVGWCIILSSFLVVTCQAQIVLDDCGDIFYKSNSRYILTKDIYSDKPYCISFTSVSSIVLDCQNHKLQYNNTLSKSGGSFVSFYKATNIFVQNCVFVDAGVDTTNCTRTVIRNNTFYQQSPVKANVRASFLSATNTVNATIYLNTFQNSVITTDIPVDLILILNCPGAIFHLNTISNLTFYSSSQVTILFDGANTEFEISSNIFQSLTHVHNSCSVDMNTINPIQSLNGIGTFFYNNTLRQITANNVASCAPSSSSTSVALDGILVVNCTSCELGYNLIDGLKGPRVPSTIPYVFSNAFTGGIYVLASSRFQIYSNSVSNVRAADAPTNETFGGAGFGIIMIGNGLRSDFRSYVYDNTISNIFGGSGSDPVLAGATLGISCYDSGIGFTYTSIYSNNVTIRTNQTTICMGISAVDGSAAWDNRVDIVADNNYSIAIGYNFTSTSFPIFSNLANVTSGWLYTKYQIAPIPSSCRTDAPIFCFPPGSLCCPLDCSQSSYNTSCFLDERYCGDSFCTEGETFENCAYDCDPPICNCSGHGNCTSKYVCLCDDGWSGSDCSISGQFLQPNATAIKVKPVYNLNITNTTFFDSKMNTTFSYSSSVELSVSSIVEFDKKNSTVQNFSIANTLPTETDRSTTEYYILDAFLYQGPRGAEILVQVYTFLKSFIAVFGDNDIPIASGTIKINVIVAGWKFASDTNSLRIYFKSSVSSSKQNQVNITSRVDDTNFFRSYQIKSDKGVTLLGDIHPKLIVDGKIQFLYDTSFETSGNGDGFLVVTVPHFNYSVVIDPSYSVLLTPPDDVDSSSENGSETTGSYLQPSTPSNRALRIGLGVGLGIGIPILLIVGVLVYKYIHQNAIFVSDS
eukprot:TRINITY_DN5768_c0_g1_i1.p1 TRINITY_DN5768_c0_g1~~TRINITY_DN5768_c0_g1_i1.p1  ORF type:complete len:875 (+),score=88.00 TRINITY_DN5768_c0_g1_i1:26-2626(+)